MKFLLPILTAILGFTAAWLLKPAPEAPAPIAQKPVRQRPAPAPKIDEEPAAPNDAPQRPADRSRSMVQASAIEPKDLQNRDDAKMARLAEALGLSPEQQQAVLKLITETQASIAPADGSGLTQAQLFTATIAAGEKIEKSLAALLTPEQAAAFADLRQRAHKNNLEAAAQSQLTDFTETMDLNPEQRSQALERLRDALEVRTASRSSGLALMTDNSILPVGPGAISASSIDMLEHTAGNASADPTESYLKFQDAQRQNLDNQLELYKGILTPAQQAQLKLTIDERRKVIDRVGDLMKR